MTSSSLPPRSHVVPHGVTMAEEAAANSALPKGFRLLGDDDAARLNDPPRAVFLYDTLEHTVTRWKVGDWHDGPFKGGTGGWTIFNASTGVVLLYPSFRTLGTGRYIGCEVIDPEDLTPLLRQSLGYPDLELLK